MQFKYILYLIFLSLFACEHHSSNINIKNKPEETKSIVQKKEIGLIVASHDQNVFGRLDNLLSLE